MKALAQVTLPQPGALNGFRFGGSAADPFVKADLLEVLLSRALLFAFVISGLIFFVKLLSAGYAYMTSGGDSGKLQAASKSLMNGAIGLLVVLSCFFIAQIVQYLFSIQFL